ncbi:MAG TPA: hypothetical protein VFZ65_18540 [Planctomycetota bacterium]|nr:hypothetical protein [Planctomycetota bacterium]
MSYSTLEPERLIQTVEKLRNRITERFPDASLGRVASALLDIARMHAKRSASIRKPNWWLRSASVLLVAGGVTTVAVVFRLLRLRVPEEWPLADVIQTFEASLSVLFFLTAGAVFALSLDLRSKRRRCLQALHELRAMAHIVDMHQLTKDPDRIVNSGVDTPSSPVRKMTRFELTRYLDYCSEMLSLMGKVAALYAQDFPDPQAVGAVDDIEDLTTGLSRKIWQKITILDAEPSRAPAPTVAAIPDSQQ